MPQHWTEQAESRGNRQRTGVAQGTTSVGLVILDNPLGSFVQSAFAMAKWATSLFLIITLGASVLVGMPLQSNEQKCAHGMSGMDCCKTAQGHGDEKDVAAARLCCAIQCPQSGTSGRVVVPLPKSSTVLAGAPHPALVQRSAQELVPVLVSSCSHSPPGSLNPAYIRNLALLI